MGTSAVKLTEIVHGISITARNVTNFVSHPIELVRQEAFRLVRDRTEEIEVPLPGRDRKAQEVNGYSQSNTTVASGTPLQKVTGSTNSVTIERASGGSPAAPEPLTKLLQGERGRYQIEKVLATREWGQIYSGIRTESNTPVRIKEYLLSDTAHAKLADQTLDRLKTVSLKRGVSQDFRLMEPWDTFVDSTKNRGYLVTQSTLPNAITLHQYLQRRGAMAPEQVRQVLLQVLQTLWFLHSHTIRFADGTGQRWLAHGNLNLDSLWIAEQPTIEGVPAQFYIYAGDLALWETAFQRVPKSAKSASSHDANDRIAPEAVHADLEALGRVSGSLLLGSEDSGTADQAAADFLQHPRWAGTTDTALKDFILKLLDHAFDSAAEARKYLLDPPPPPAPVAPTQPAEEEPSASVADAVPNRLPFSLQLLLVLIALVVAAVAGLWLAISQRKPLPVGEEPSLVPRTRTLAALESPLPPDTRFLYALVSPSWRYGFRRGRVSFDRSLQQELAYRNYPNSGLIAYIAVADALPPEVVWRGLRAGNFTFALIDSQAKLPGQEQSRECPPQDVKARDCWVQELVAYDALVPVVAFSDPQRSSNIPKALKGKLSLEQLRNLYTGNSNWNASAQLQKAPVNLYRSNDPDSLVDSQFFEQRVLRNSAQDIQAFRKLTSNQAAVSEMFKQILQDFEGGQRPVVGIGFSRLSMAFGQCSIYPLAVGEPGQEVQVLQRNGDSITPDLDLCQAKGSYWPDSRVFMQNRYPLTYPLSVLYYRQKGNRQPEQAAKFFIQALQTQEGQCLLSEAGLVPRLPVRLKPICLESEGAQP